MKIRLGSLLLLIIIMLYVASSCANNIDSTEGVIWEEYDNIIMEPVSSISEIRLYSYTEAGAKELVVQDRAAIEDIYALIKEISLDKKTDIAVLDDGLSIEVIYDENKSYKLSFEGKIAVISKTERYQTNNFSDLSRYVNNAIYENEKK